MDDKRLGFLSFGHWHPATRAPSAREGAVALSNLQDHRPQNFS
jgi:hypothetical protein